MRQGFLTLLVLLALPSVHGSYERNACARLVIQSATANHYPLLRSGSIMPIEVDNSRLALKNTFRFMKGWYEFVQLHSPNQILLFDSRSKSQGPTHDFPPRENAITAMAMDENDFFYYATGSTIWIENQLNGRRRPITAGLDVLGRTPVEIKNLGVYYFIDPGNGNHFSLIAAVDRADRILLWKFLDDPAEEPNNIIFLGTVPNPGPTSETVSPYVFQRRNDRGDLETRYLVAAGFSDNQVKVFESDLNPQIDQRTLKLRGLFRVSDSSDNPKVVGTTITESDAGGTGNRIYITGLAKDSIRVAEYLPGAKSDYATIKQPTVVEPISGGEALGLALYQRVKVPMYSFQGIIYVPNGVRPFSFKQGSRLPSQLHVDPIENYF